MAAEDEAFGGLTPLAHANNGLANRGKLQPSLSTSDIPTARTIGFNPASPPGGPKGIGGDRHMRRDSASEFGNVRHAFLCF